MRSASRRRPRCTATSTRCSDSATCAATRPSRGRSRCATTPTAAPSWSAGPFATCRSSAMSPPAPNVLAEENVEELLPVPVDFTGDGELFMLRVRGDSMIELGILDGDFVVATQITNPHNGDIVVAGIPDGEATIKTYSRSGADVTLTPANSTMEPMTFTRRSGRDLRQGRHGHAPLLTAAAAHFPGGPQRVGSSEVGRDGRRRQRQRCPRPLHGWRVRREPPPRSHRSSVVGRGTPADSAATLEQPRSAPMRRPVPEPGVTPTAPRHDQRHAHDDARHQQCQAHRCA